MLVNLRRNWYAPNNTLYEKSANPHDFPESWKDQLPKGAEVLEGGKVVAVGVNTANGATLTKPEAVDDDVKSVGGALDTKGIEQPSQTVAAAEKGAEALNVDQVGGKPRESGPAVQVGAKK